MAGHGRRSLVTGVHTLDALIRTAEQEADWTGLLLDRPDGDWPMMVFIGSMHGEVETYVGSCDPPPAIKESDRFSLEALPQVLWQRGVAEPESVPRAAVLMSTWCPLWRASAGASTEGGARRGRRARPGQVPLLSEGLSVHAADVTECRALQAPVVRREKKPPLVGEWEEVEACDARVMQFLMRIVGAEAGTKVGARR